MSILVDSRPHAEAIKAALDASLGPWSAYDYDDVPGTNGKSGPVPGIFVAISIERRYNPVVRVPGRASAAGWRYAFRSVGRTVDECRWAQNKVAEALNEKRLLIEGVYTSRLQYESGQAAEQDDKRFAALDIYTTRH